METYQYIDFLKSGVNAGYRRTALEIMFGINRNGLTNILAGRTPLPIPAKNRIDRWLSGEDVKEKAKFLKKPLKEPDIEVKSMIGDFEATFTSEETQSYLFKIELATTEEAQVLAQEINNSKTLSRRDKVLLTLKVQNKLK